jgi:thioester reductase-like protein
LASPPTILLTGATGLLGSYLLRDLVLSGVPLAVIARPTRRVSAQERVATIVRGWEEALGVSLPLPTVLVGDLGQPLCGMGQAEQGWLREHCDGVVHNAASLTFRGTDRAAEPWQTNVGGTAAMLSLAEATGIRHLHQVSTAYVAGLRSSTVLEEELDVGQEYGNDYERSKAEAEKMVRAADCLDTVTVYRPSIIVGDSVTSYTSTYHGFYAALRLGHTLLTRVPLGSTSGPALLSLLGIDPAARKNFVPVDWVSAVITRSIHTPTAWGQTFHLTHPRPLAMEFVATIIQEAVEAYSEAAPPDAADICDEQWFADHLRVQLDVYQRYFRTDPTFDSRHTAELAADLPCPTLDRDTLLRMAKFAIAHNFGWFPPDAVAVTSSARQTLLPHAAQAGSSNLQPVT